LLKELEILNKIYKELNGIEIILQKKVNTYDGTRDRCCVYAHDYIPYEEYKPPKFVLVYKIPCFNFHIDSF